MPIHPHVYLYHRLFIAVCIFLLGILTAPNAFAAEQNFLPQSTLNGPGGDVPAPGQRYRTLTGWLFAAFEEHHRPDDRAAIAKAMNREMKAFHKLSKRQKEKYFLNLIQDSATMEIVALENGWYGKVILSAALDYMVGSMSNGLADNLKLSKLSSAIIGTGSTSTAGLSANALGSHFQSTMGGFRQMLLTQYLKSRCGCNQPNPSLKPPKAWNSLVLPETNQTYQTALGRVLGSVNKSHTSITQWTGNADVAITHGELKRIKEMRSKNPQKLAAYLTHFAYDIEALQEEYLTDARAVTPTKVFGSVSMAAMSSAVGALAPPAGLLMSAGFTAATTWADLSTEQQIMLTLANMRSNVLRELDSLPGKCGCIEESKLLVLDASSSMKDDNRMEKSKQSIRRVMAGMKGKIEVGLIVFYDCGRIEVAQEFTTDPALIGAAADKVRPTGGTPLYAAVKTADEYLKKHASSKKQSAVLLSDGKDTCQ